MKDSLVNVHLFPFSASCTTVMGILFVRNNELLLEQLTHNFCICICIFYGVGPILVFTLRERERESSRVYGELL